MASGAGIQAVTFDRMALGDCRPVYTIKVPLRVMSSNCVVILSERSESKDLRT